VNNGEWLIVRNADYGGNIVRERIVLSKQLLRGGTPVGALVRGVTCRK
jgi:hypothetical protein